MVELRLVHEANKALVRSQPLTAVFVGATQGVGEYTLRQLAKAHGDEGKGLRAYLIGRNEEAANAILAECQQFCPDAHLRFLKSGDLTLLWEVDQSCRQLATALRDEASMDSDPPRIDILCMSQAAIRFGTPEFTDEGLEVSMSLLYYSRMRFIDQLLPLLLASSLPAHVISIMAAGMENFGKFFPDDLSLTKDPAAHYSYINCRVSCGRMTTMYFERLAQQHAGRLSLVHAFPGTVFGPSYWSPSLPLWFRATWYVLYPIINRFKAISPEESGQRTLFFATPRYSARLEGRRSSEDVATSTDEVLGGGAYSCGPQNQVYDIQKSYTKLRDDGFESKVWEHTHRVFDMIESGKRFTE